MDGSQDIEGSTKKRKSCPSLNDDEDEEEKIEKFFALVRGIREAREHILKASSADGILLFEQQSNKNKKMKNGEEEKAKALPWNPSFQPEDFSQDDLLLKISPITPCADSSQIVQGSSHKQDIKDGLDLRLSL
ncbi:hypothetical protein NMG60_11035160 [Bertholletia excelsa]